MARIFCPVKKISSLTHENTSLFDPPLPPMVRAWATGLVKAGSQTPGLSATTLRNRASQSQKSESSRKDTGVWQKWSAL